MDAMSDENERQAVLPDEVKTLRRPSLPVFLFYIGRDWLLIIASIYAAITFKHWWTSVLAILVIGNRQHAISLMLHDASHYCASANKKVNDFFGNMLAAYPMGFSLKSYRNFHFQHHRDPNGKADGELWHKKSFAPEWDLPMKTWKIYFMAMKDLFGLGSLNLIYLVKLTAPKSIKDALPPMIFQTTVIGSLLLTRNYASLIYWYAGLLTSFCACFRMRVWYEHLGIKDTHRVDLRWWEKVLFVPHNGGLHFEHHEAPWVPQHLLPEMRKMIVYPKVISSKELFQKYEQSPVIVSGEWGNLYDQKESEKKKSVA